MKLLFLPGASGNREFWYPVAERLGDLGSATILGWPGLGGVAPRPDVTHFDHLVALVEAHLEPGAHIIAQSMGTVVALRTALIHACLKAQTPATAHLASMVLVATPGGIDVERFGASDWRHGAAEWHPENAPRYFLDEKSDFSAQIRTIGCPVLLISGGRDLLSPPAVSEHFTTLIQGSTHVSLPEGEHDLAKVYPDFLASQIRRHLAPR